MSGFLRRLSERARGLPSPVRSAARLPYASPPVLVDMGDDPPRTSDGVHQLQGPGSNPAAIVSTPPSRQAPPRGMVHGAAKEHRDESRRAAAGDDDGANETWARAAHAAGPQPPEPATKYQEQQVPEPQWEFLLPADHSEAVRPAPSKMAGRTDRGPQAGGRSGPSEETTEVHVSIGRIEVTAVQEAPPPKRQPRRVAKPMTLAEYLARRRGDHQ